MFKPLLRVLPSMSGNISLNCYIDSNVQLNNKDEYEVNIQHAGIIPLQNELYRTNNEISLVYDKWEQNVKTYYVANKDTFYEDNFIYNEKDYQPINVTNITTPNRNTNYEMGCKRIDAASAQKYQFNFFAPFYIDSADDLPDYFEISIKITNYLTKKIRINIGKDSRTNYLKYYLKRYLSKIDNNVIQMLPESYQAAYFGIDCLHGGLVQIKDNVIGKLYNNQSTINNFDNTICEGFKRNNLIIRQVIPLAFSFNVNDFLSYNEQLKYNFKYPMTITGLYKNENLAFNLYDFNIDYVRYNPFVTVINNNNITIKKSDENVMDQTYPSLNEGFYCNYNKTNKITPRYCRWKLKYSTDENPYITNLSFAFSKLSNSNFNYGGFPTIINSNKPTAKIQYRNLIYNTEDGKFAKYLNNHISTWYTLVKNPDEILLDKNFCNTDDDKAYYKGILYNLQSLYSKYPDMPKIDKFGVFVYPTMKNVKNEESVFAKNIIDKSGNYNAAYNNILYDKTINRYSPIFKDTSNFSNSSGCKVYNDDYFVRNKNGNGDYILLDDFNKYNEFFSLTELRNSALDQIQVEHIFTLLENSKETSAVFENAYELIDIYNYDNLFNIDDDNSLSIFSLAKKIDFEKQLYLSKNSTNIKIHFSENELHNNKDKKYSIFQKDTFISVYAFLKKYNNISGVNLDEIIHSLNIYNYIPYSNTDIIYKTTETTLINSNYFIKQSSTNKSYIFIDSFNLKNMKPSIDLINLPAINSYAKLNSITDLILWYHKMLQKKYDFIIDETNDSLSNYLYVRTRYIVKKNNKFYIKDKFITLYNYLKSNFGNITLSTNRFFNNLSYDDISKKFILNLDYLKSEKTVIEKKLEFSLYYKSTFYKVNDEILDLYKKYNYKFLYYKYDKNPNENYELFNVIDCDDEKELIDYTEFENDIYTDSVVLIGNNLLKYDTGFENEFKYMLLDNIIYKDSSKFYKYDIYDVDTMIDKRIIYGDNEISADTQTFDKVKTITTSFINNSSKTYDNLNIYKNSDGTVYGYYIINENFVNHVAAFNINEEDSNSKIFTQINGENLDFDTIYKHFNELNCIFDTTLFETYNNLASNIILKPTRFVINLYYRQYLIDTGNSSTSYKYELFYPQDYNGEKNIYDIKYIGKKNTPKINLNRYLDNIVPYINKIDYISDLYFLKYKTTNSEISENNMYCVSQKSPYKNEKIKIVDKINTSTFKDEKVRNVSLYETKYYNDSVIHNLYTSFTVVLNDMYDKNKISELETEEENIKQFKNYLNNNLNTYIEDENLILFLYKKYNISYNVDPYIINSTTKLYKLTYKFTLR